MEEQHWDSSGIVKLEPEDIGDSENVTNEYNITTATSLQSLEDEQKPSDIGETGFYHIDVKSEGLVELPIDDNDPSQNTDPLIHDANPPRKVFSCELCYYNSFYFHSFARHKRNHQPPMETNVSPKPIKDSVTKHQRKESQLQNHSKINSDGQQFASNICTSPPATRSAMTKHYCPHSTEINHECDEYGLKFKFKLAKQINHSKKKEQCSQCDYKTSRKANLAIHELIHAEERPFVCDKCEFASKNSTCLARHRRVRAAVRKYRCSECCFGTNLEKGLVIHLRTHSGKRPFASNICTSRPVTNSTEMNHECDEYGIIFKFKHILARQKLNHSKKKKHQCSQCDYKTNRKANLDIHVRIHSEERPFACDKCEYASKSRSSLAKHRRLYAAVRRYRCSECCFGTNHKNGLIFHIRTHSGERPLVSGV